MQIQNTLEFLHWVLFLLEEQFLHIQQPPTYTHTFRACIEFTGHPVHFMPPRGMDTRWYPVTGEGEDGRACLGFQKLFENPLPPTLYSLPNSSFGRQSDLNK